MDLKFNIIMDNNKVINKLAKVKNFDLALYFANYSQKELIPEIAELAYEHFFLTKDYESGIKLAEKYFPNKLTALLFLHLDEKISDLEKEVSKETLVEKINFEDTYEENNELTFNNLKESYLNLIKFAQKYSKNEHAIILSKNNAHIMDIGYEIKFVDELRTKNLKFLTDNKQREIYKIYLSQTIFNEEYEISAIIKKKADKLNPEILKNFDHANYKQYANKKIKQVFLERFISDK